MPLPQLLDAGRVMRLDACPDRDAVLSAAAAALAGDGDGDASVAEELGEGLRRREQLGSTGIGHGVAIPHARSAWLSQPRAVFLGLARPVDFGAADGAPVDLVLALAVPQDDVQGHLALLSELAELLSDETLRERLRSCRDATALHAALLGQVTTS